MLESREFLMDRFALAFSRYRHPLGRFRNGEDVRTHADE